MYPLTLHEITIFAIYKNTSTNNLYVIFNVQCLCNCKDNVLVEILQGQTHGFQMTFTACFPYVFTPVFHVLFQVFFTVNFLWKIHADRHVC